MDEDIKKNIMKTGTTILGIVCKDGVVMASDRQVSLGQSIVGKKNFQKTMLATPYLAISVCGTASDAQRLVKLISAELKLKELRSKTRPTIKQAANLAATMSFSNIRQPSMIPSTVGLLMAGFDKDGKVELYTIGMDGTVDIVEDYDASVGSGMPYVLGLLERQYKKDLTVEEGIELAKESLKSSTQRDTASGYGLDVFAITEDEIKRVVSQTIEPNYKDQ